MASLFLSSNFNDMVYFYWFGVQDQHANLIFRDYTIISPWKERVGQDKPQFNGKINNGVQHCWLESALINLKETINEQDVGGSFSMHSHNHVLSVGGVTLLDLDLYGELCLEISIRPSSPMASGIFLDLQNGYSPKSENHDNC